MSVATERTALAPQSLAQVGGGDGAAPPNHVAIIMDGNGRWAMQQGLPRAEGHRRGIEALRRTVRAAAEFNLRYLTIYSFSSENWSRPATEVIELMGLLKLFVRNDLTELHQNDIRVRVIGRRDDLAADIRLLLEEAEGLTRANTGMTLVVAFNYGSRQELVRVAQRIADDVAAGVIDAAAVGAEAVEARLDTAGIPDPDLVIRTSGELRLSNFLLWQAAYAEFVFTPVLWPDFDGAALQAAIRDFRQRDRRFGGLGAGVP